MQRENRFDFERSEIKDCPERRDFPDAGEETLELEALSDEDFQFGLKYYNALLRR